MHAPGQELIFSNQNPAAKFLLREEPDEEEEDDEDDDDTDNEENEDSDDGYSE